MDKLSVLMLAGIINGSVYGLVGLSLSIIYGANRVINFAQGDFVMLGAMCSVMFMVTFTLPWPLALVAIAAVVLIGGLLLEFLVYKPLEKRNASHITIMIGTLAFATIVHGVAKLVWGTEQQFIPPIFSIDTLVIGPLTTNPQQLAIVVAFVVFLVVMWFLLYRTQFGLCFRATGVNPRIALLMGIQPQRIIRFSFLISALVSGVAGILVGPFLGGQISMGLLLTVKGFLAAILGGLGGPFAAAAGGIVIGLMESFMAGYGTSLYAEPVVFLLILLVLFVRPYGLLGDYEAVKR